jgi:hypothetical protein
MIAHFQNGRRAMRIALIAAAIGLALSILGAILDVRQTAAAYLIAFVFVVSVAIGLLTFVKAAHVMDATWTTAVRRLAESGAAILPLCLLLFIPICFALGQLYPWMHPERIKNHRVAELLNHKRVVMNAPFFIARAFIFLGFWAGTAWLVRGWSLRMDASRAVDLRPRLRAFSSATLPMIGLTATFAVFDWMMSLSPDFYSTMYGLYVLSGGFVAAIGLLAILMAVVPTSELSRSHWYAIGRLLFAFLVFWAYTGFFQFLIIWIGGKPLEVKFYLARLQPGDRWTTWFLVFGHFGAPWLVLLSYFMRRHRLTVTLLGAWIFVCHYVDMHWLVAAHRGAFPWQWQDAAALLFMVGSAVAWAIFCQRGLPLVALGDPTYERALAYESR